MNGSRGLLLLAAGMGGVAAAFAVSRRSPHRRQIISPRSNEAIADRPQHVATEAGRRLNVSSALLSMSVLADSGLEHYRGSFQNRAMFIPLVTSSVTLAASLFGAFDPRASKHLFRDVVYACAAATGFAGFGFHAYNIGKRPGGFSWLNLFYSAPIGAPIAMTLAGLLGRAAERVRDSEPGKHATIFNEPAGPLLADVAALGIIGTAGEAGLLHFRGAFHNPAMLLPVTLPPVSALMLASSVRWPQIASPRATRLALRLTAALGLLGVGFHAFGVSRNMGGWRNWSQNILNGPPLPAPPSFTGLALAGLAALELHEEHVHG